MALLHLTDSNFKREALASELPVLVDFWAERCGPCKMIAPFIKDLAHEFKGKAKVAKVNVEESPRLASQYGIMSIPTIIFFKDGRVMEQVAGALNKAELKKKLQAYI